jgi:hypothetical protein
MAWGFRLLGRFGAAEVTSNGEVLVRDYKHSEPFIVQLTDATATNIITPRSNEQFTLTGFYATTAISGTQDKLIFSLDMARQQSSGFATPNTPITESKFLNCDRTSATGIITVTIFGYFEPAHNEYQ